MTKKILQIHDHAGNAIINFVVENLASYPTAGNVGRLVMNTTTGEIGVDDGTTFLPLLTAVAWGDVTGKPSTFTPSAHTHVVADVTGLQGALDDKAPLASPSLTGNPTAPTQTAGNNTARLATTAFVHAAIGALGGGDMLISVYDSNDDGKVDAADVADAAPWSGITGKPSTFAPSAHTHAQADITGLVAALAGKAATSHTHTASQITDFDAEVEAKIFAQDALFSAGVGIGGASPDSTNKLSVNTEAALFSNAGSDMRLTLNKAAVGDDVALTYQDGFSTRALLGLFANDDWTLKVSPNGSTFYDAIVVDKDSGEVDFPAGVTGVASDEFGSGEVINTDYMAAKGTDLFTNGTLLLGNSYNFPTPFVYDAVVTPGLPGAAKHRGYSSGTRISDEFLPINPNLVYRLGVFFREDDYNHLQFMGLAMYDADRSLITSDMHMRYRQDGVDSYTTLTAPMTPGDTTMRVDNAAGWNDNPGANDSGLTIFEYKNSFGFKYDYYTKLFRRAMFNGSGSVNKTTNVITFNQALPLYMGNPDDVNGTWPIGTRVANGWTAGTYKYCFYSAYRVPTLGQWYSILNYVGGVDLSGSNTTNNFSPGTAYCKVFWLPNYSNRAGGWNGYPDSGTGHNMWVSGVSVVSEYTGKHLPVTSGAASGRRTLKVLRINAAGTASEVVTPSMTQELV